MVGSNPHFVRACASTLLVSATVSGALAGNVLIPVGDRRDHVFDASRNLLYITTANGVIQRYDLASSQLRTPFAVGEALNGGDTTPDNQYLYVTDAAVGATTGFVRKVDLATGAHTTLEYERESGDEGGGWDLKVGSHGKALLSTRLNGSGRVPFREIDTTLDTISVRTDLPLRNDVRTRTHINRSADRRTMLMVESDTSSGPVSRYDAATDTFPVGTRAETILSNSFSAVSRNGGLFALERRNRTVWILDRDLNEVTNLLGLRGGLIFHPQSAILFATDPESSDIVALDANTWTELDRYPIGENITSDTFPLGAGEMSINADGTLIAISTPSGVRLISVPEPSCALMATCFALLVQRGRGRAKRVS